VDCASRPAKLITANNSNNKLLYDWMIVITMLRVLIVPMLRQCALRIWIPRRGINTRLDKGFSPPIGFLPIPQTFYGAGEEVGQSREHREHSKGHSWVGWQGGVGASYKGSVSRHMISVGYWYWAN